MALFFLIVFVVFGTIIIKEKSTTLFLPKIKNSINDYITEKYSSLELQKEDINIENNTYTMKVMNTKNKNHYFLIKYTNKEITDTYKEDYIEGKTLITHLNQVIEQTIYIKTNNKYTVKINNTYDKFSDKVKELLLKEENLEQLKIYTIETEITTSWDINTIINTITSTMTTLDNKNITPKNYTITITDQNDITKSVKISNLTINHIKNNNLPIIINDIINNEQTSILTKNKITYEYLN